MTWVGWLFARVERIVLFLAGVAGIAVAIFTLFFREPPPPIVPKPMPVASDGTISALSAALSANECRVQAVSIRSFEQSDTAAEDSTHGQPGVFMQANIQLDDHVFTVQGNGRGAAAASNAETLLIENAILQAKELDLCD